MSDGISDDCLECNFGYYLYKGICFPNEILRI